jgi:CubicO group peptidase (beta-lactamase class C family)
VSPAIRFSLWAHGIAVELPSKTRLISVISTAVFIAWLALASWAQNVHATSSASTPDFAKIDSYIQAQLDESRMPGLALGIVQGDQIVHLQGFGRADDSGREVTPQTPFFIGSNSKSFTALAVMQLVEAGNMRLDAPVHEYLPWFRVADPSASAIITVRQLLNQTSGFSTITGRSILVGSETETLEQAVRNLRTEALASSVGTFYNYSNANYLILGLLVQTISQESYGDYIEQHIFQPLDMSHSFTSQDPARRAGLATGYRYWFGLPVAFDAPYLAAALSAGGLISTAEDMTHYLAMYLDGGTYHGRVLLSAEGISQMESPGAQPADATYGMGWATGTVGGVKVIWHNGDEPAFHTGMVLVPQGGWGIIVLENVDSGNPLVASQIRVIEDGVTKLVAGDQRTTGTGIGFLYLVFDLIVIIVIALQFWSLVRLFRRRGHLELPLRGLSHAVGQGRQWVLPLLWEIGVPVVIWLGLPYQADASWGVLLLFAPDMSAAVLVIAGLFVLTGLVRIIAGLSHFVPSSASSKPFEILPSDRGVVQGLPIHNPNVM